MMAPNTPEKQGNKRAAESEPGPSGRITRSRKKAAAAEAAHSAPKAGPSASGTAAPDTAAPDVKKKGSQRDRDRDNRIKAVVGAVGSALQAAKAAGTLSSEWADFARKYRGNLASLADSNTRPMSLKETTDLLNEALGDEEKTEDKGKGEEDSATKEGGGADKPSAARA
ncbi:hypothetical protein DL769_009414 [Monosporascus sp. CRB-8-3]|nr:hypothetical protein DL769_009414 [Monosporascus sp. CRB-8-3]